MYIYFTYNATFYKTFEVSQCARFNSWLVLGPVMPKTLEVGTTNHNWSARCQYNVTGWVSMWAYDMLS